MDSFVLEWNKFNQEVCKRVGSQAIELVKWKREGVFIDLNEKELSLLQKKNKRLIKITEPYLKQFSTTFLDKPHLIVLIDTEGWVIHKTGRMEVESGNEKMLDSGANWSIQSLGDNGVGMALNKKRPVLVYGITLPGLFTGNGVILGIPLMMEEKVQAVIGVLTFKEYSYPPQLSFLLTVKKFIEKDYQRERDILDKLIELEKLIAMGKTLRLIIHDIKNPLANIRAISQFGTLVLRESKGEEYFERIIKNIDALTEIIDDRIAEIKSIEMVEELPISTIKRVISIFRPDLESKKVKLSLNVLNEEVVRFQPGMFKRVLENLLDNALEALDEGGEIVIQVLSDGDYLKVIITDTGYGIPEKVQENLFKPFVSGKDGSLGLGLYLSRYIIEEVHNGELNYTTEPGKGTTFIIHLPIVKKLNF